MQHLTLLGDTLIDNRHYADPDVAVQIRRILGAEWRVTSLAEDGDHAEDVRLALPHLEAGSLVFLSVGGIDTFGIYPPLSSWMPRRASALMRELSAELARFRRNFTPLLDALADHRLLIATIPMPCFRGRDAALNGPYEMVVRVYNDLIQSEAVQRNHKILETRQLLDTPADFADAFAPTVRGGAKLASAVADWARACADAADRKSETC